MKIKLKIKMLALFMSAFFLTSPAVAEIRVAFFALKSWNGKIIQLQDHGRFNHVAVSFGSGWLEASPKWGVRWVTSLDKIGKPVSVLVASRAALVWRDVAQYWNQPYDFTFTWRGPYQYCSKLVAQVLGVPPRPMAFNSSHWRREWRDHRGELGISPDALFSALLAQGDFEVRRASNVSAGRLAKFNMPCKAALPKLAAP